MFFDPSQVQSHAGRIYLKKLQMNFIQQNQRAKSQTYVPLC